LDIATGLRDLATPPGNGLEARHGNREGQYSIRINDQWRICFVWRDQDAYNVEILREDFMKPLRLSMNKLALDLHVPVTRIAEILHSRRSVTPDTALRLGRYFNTSARFWLNAQAAYDLEVAEDESRRSIERQVRPLAEVS